MHLSYKAINLPFHYPFTISRGTKTHQPSLVVELEHRGIKGYGEAPAITYYDITVEKMIADLERKKRMVENFAFTTPDRYWHYLHHLFPLNSFLVCALDIAAWDLFGKLRGLPLHRLWGYEFNHNVVTDYTIGIDTLDKMVAKMKAFPWPVYKIKLGTPNDIEIIHALRKETEAVFRIDANSGWTLTEALDKIPKLAPLQIEFIEQPLDKKDQEGMKILFAQSAIPLFADESCVAETDVQNCAGHFHGINIKLTKCSGLTPALRMIREARKLGLKVMAGSMNETTVGTAAIVHLLPMLDHIDADGPLLLAEDIAEGLQFINGQIHISNTAGLGITMKEGFFQN
ncbi:MAG TPA: dipeptide epimerase [Flavitalea sp.]|nr:dipeptide epimerase [Flavitalea sp.]